MDYWEEAEGEGWLAARKLHTLLSAALNEKIIAGEIDIATVVNGKPWLIAVKRKAANDGKSAWAEWVAGDDPADVADSLPELTSLTKRVFKRLV